MNTKWISVKDRLPEKKGNYIGWDTTNNKICIAECYDTIINLKVELTFQPYISHWMPLPKEPKAS